MLLSKYSDNLALDIIALLLNRRKALKLETIMDQPKLVKDIEDRLKTKVVEAAAPAVRFNKKESESESSHSLDSADE